jgi:hypothetical protein
MTPDFKTIDESEQLYPEHGEQVVLISSDSR